MHDQDSYSLYCTMLLQEYSQYGISHGDVDPWIMDACRHYIAGESSTDNEIIQEVRV